jgi:hypothetical protein
LGLVLELIKVLSVHCECVEAASIEWLEKKTTSYIPQASGTEGEKL